MTTLDIIIVNWNAGGQLRACIESIAKTCGDGFRISRIVVVDNASVDGSAKDIDDGRLAIELIQNSANRGFGRACNQGTVGSSADYLLFLNPDVRLFESSLAGPLDFMEGRSADSIGVCGIQLVGESGEIAKTCARFPSAARFAWNLFGLDRLNRRAFQGLALTSWDHRDSREVDHVIGAFFLVRRRVFEALHGFDERFFVYLEDIDFSLRAMRKGWKSYYLANVQAFHKGAGTTAQAKGRTLYYFLKSRIQYGFKHFNPFAATLLMLSTLLIEPVLRLVVTVFTAKFRQAGEAVKAFGLLWKDVLTAPLSFFGKENR